MYKRWLGKRRKRKRTWIGQTQCRPDSLCQPQWSTHSQDRSSEAYRFGLSFCVTTLSSHWPRAARSKVCASHWDEPCGLQWLGPFCWSQLGWRSFHKGRSALTHLWAFHVFCCWSEFFLNRILLLCLWLCWVFIAAWSSLVAVSEAPL